jgi:hypothetical protein
MTATPALQFADLPPEIRWAVQEWLPPDAFWDSESRAAAEEIFTKQNHELVEWMREFGQSFVQCYWFAQKYRPMRKKMVRDSQLKPIKTGRVVRGLAEINDVILALPNYCIEIANMTYKFNQNGELVIICANNFEESGKRAIGFREPLKVTLGALGIQIRPLLLLCEFEVPAEKLFEALMRWPRHDLGGGELIILNPY